MTLPRRFVELLAGVAPAAIEGCMDLKIYEVVLAEEARQAVLSPLGGGQ
jgi:hypothetical protein